MSTSLIIDDLFVEEGYRQFLHYYLPVYGDKVQKPLSYLALTCAAASYLGRDIEKTHIFYLEDRKSSFLERHLVALARKVAGELEGNSSDAPSHDIPEKYLVEYIDNAFGLDQAQLLGRSSNTRFHLSSLLAVEAAQFAAGCESAIIMADDPIYEMATSCGDLIFLRLGDMTRMPPKIQWVDICHIFCTAYGVDL